MDESFVIEDLRSPNFKTTIKNLSALSIATGKDIYYNFVRDNQALIIQYDNQQIIWTHRESSKQEMKKLLMEYDCLEDHKIRDHNEPKKLVKVKKTFFNTRVKDEKLINLQKDIREILKQAEDKNFPVNFHFDEESRVLIAVNPEHKENGTLKQWTEEDLGSHRIDTLMAVLRYESNKFNKLDINIYDQTAGEEPVAVLSIDRNEAANKLVHDRGLQKFQTKLGKILRYASDNEISLNFHFDEATGSLKIKNPDDKISKQIAGWTPEELRECKMTELAHIIRMEADRTEKQDINIFRHSSGMEPALVIKQGVFKRSIPKEDMKPEPKKERSVAPTNLVGLINYINMVGKYSVIEFNPEQEKNVTCTVDNKKFDICLGELSKGEALYLMQNNIRHIYSVTGIDEKEAMVDVIPRVATEKSKLLGNIRDLMVPERIIVPTAELRNKIQRIKKAGITEKPAYNGITMVKNDKVCDKPIKPEVKEKKVSIKSVKPVTKKEEQKSAQPSWQYFPEGATNETAIFKYIVEKKTGQQGSRIYCGAQLLNGSEGKDQYLSLKFELYGEGMPNPPKHGKFGEIKEMLSNNASTCNRSFQIYEKGEYRVSMIATITCDNKNTNFTKWNKEAFKKSEISQRGFKVLAKKTDNGSALSV